jgi:4-amino-4-deoxy-L-arabinose transferase-like glycosyltransferase
MLFMTWKQSLWILIIGSALIRLISAFSLGLANDEAYHYLYAANPSLSYYDHPSMMAWVELAGVYVTAGTISPWALRLGFVLLFAGSTWILARLTARYFGGWAGFLAAFALNISGYYGLAASTLVLPDGPLLFFWLLTIDRLSFALESDDAHLRPWIWVGLGWGGAMLSKYHAVFLPAGAALYVLLDRASRRWIYRPGPYVAFGLGLALFSPVLVWNAGHHWASFLFQGGRAVGSVMPRPDYLALALLAQVAYLFPWVWLPLVMILVRGIRSWMSGQIQPQPERLLLCLAVVPLALFTAVACFRFVLPHWGLIGLATLLPLLGRRWAILLARNPVRVRRLLAGGVVWSLVVLGVAIFQFATGWFQRSDQRSFGLLSRRTDPTVELYGWDQVASRIRALRLLDDPRTFVFTRYWYESAHMAYALGGNVPVLCYNTDDSRGFAFWSRPEDWVGRDGILVTVDEPVNSETMLYGEAPYFARWFDRVEPVADFWVERMSKRVRHIALYRCIKQRVAFPFALDHRDVLARRPPPLTPPTQAVR